MGLSVEVDPCDEYVVEVGPSDDVVELDKVDEIVGDSEVDDSVCDVENDVLDVTPVVEPDVADESEV